MRRFFLTMCLFYGLISHAQEDLLSELDSTQVEDNFAPPAFKALQLVTFQSTKMPAAKEWYVVVSHRFGSVKDGFDTFFGLDNATTKLGAIYGVTPWLSASFSRHTMLKMYEGSLKYRLVRQTSDFPVEIAGYSTLDVNTFVEKDQYPGLSFSDRLIYVNQILASSRISDRISVELIPSFVHRNLYEPTIENNNQFSLGAGGRLKLTKRMALNVEYAYGFDQPDYYKDPLSVGLDIETGGHVFQLVFTNSQSLSESGYLTNAAGRWGKGDFFFGFNLYRVF